MATSLGQSSKLSDRASKSKYEKETKTRKNGVCPNCGSMTNTESPDSNHAVRKIIGDDIETDPKEYQFVLGVDIKLREHPLLFQSLTKSIYDVEWLRDEYCPIVILLKIDGFYAAKEASFYVHLSTHQNIVQTSGLIESTNSVMLLQEYASIHGTLYDVFSQNYAFSEKLLCEMFIQIVDGMIHLSQNHIVHGNLTIRNILVFPSDEGESQNFILKITSFGLYPYSQIFTPVDKRQSITNIILDQYTAPEILKNKRKESYSEKSDVYSMGVLMYDAFLQCASFKSQQDDRRGTPLKNDRLIKRPENCGAKMFDLIKMCTSLVPTDRPNFQNVKDILTTLAYESIVPNKHTNLNSANQGK
ncbi:unnamed protein product [Didymodactylos carnosus]|uniref:Protein kinase domain-containing protein n=1 Tax=Didymodactylos carnosus TaxID=1234261 RepID=A0A8S2F683_9BILA|nr:unnamed protein product [Didymodactylos carnosus]CAF4147602.1 unnamed protein product [Didymodactylos carnosus]